MNPKKSQPQEEIVVYMSTKGLSQSDIYPLISQTFSRERFSELVNKISLFLSQDVETESSDVRFGIIFTDF